MPRATIPARTVRVSITTPARNYFMVRDVAVWAILIVVAVLTIGWIGYRIAQPATTTAAPAAVVRTPSATASPAAPIVAVPSKIDVYHHGMTSPRQSAAPSPDSPEERWRQYQERRLRERAER